MKEALLLVLFIKVPATCVWGTDSEKKAFLSVRRSVFVDKVWTGCRTPTPMLIHKDMQYVGYYDAERRMTVAARKLDSDKWTYKKLDDLIGWDSHNYISLGIDPDGCLHVSGNMHGRALRYYRSTRPGDVTSLVGIHRMTGAQESRVTYPRFFTGDGGRLYFMYRDGTSGNGDVLINVYDSAARKWARVGTTPFLGSDGSVNAYLCQPKPDNRGVFHTAWVWRDTGDVVTNHDVCYARTRGNGLESWCRSNGEPYQLPITQKTAEIIDPVPVKNGLRNNIQLSFDAHNRPMVTYTRYNPLDEKFTQLIVLRLEDSGWKRYQITDWKDRDEFSGGGTIGAKVRFAGPASTGDGRSLYQVFINEFISPHILIHFLDPDTLQPLEKPVPLYPADLDTLPKSASESWSINWMGTSMESWVDFDLQSLEKTGSVWVLRWITLRPNRDSARASIPPPAPLEVIEFIKSR